MGADIKRQLQQCREKVAILEARESDLLKELRPLVDETRYGISPIRDQVFISYSHHDKFWCDLLTTMMVPLVQKGMIDFWVDTLIGPGRRWEVEIEAALKRAKVAVLIISPNYLASPFIRDVELPSILKAQEESGATIIWFPVSASLVRRTEIINFQAAIEPQRPLNGMAEAERGEALVRIAEAIDAAYRA